MSSPMRSVRCATRSRPRSSNDRPSRSTSSPTCCSATSPGRPATACPARVSRHGSSPTSRSTGRRGARPRTASGTSRRSSNAARRSRWRSCCASSGSPSRSIPARCYAAVPEHSPLVGDDRLERAGLTAEIAHPDPVDRSGRRRDRVRRRDHLRGPVRTRRGDRRRRHEHAARRPLRRPRRLDRLDAREARRPAARLPPRRRPRLAHDRSESASFRSADRTKRGTFR